MTSALRTARALTAVALAALGSAVYLGLTHSLWLMAACLYVAAFFAWCAHRDHQHHRTLRARAALRERAVSGLPVQPAVFDTVPCCDLAGHADGRTHGADCLRRLAAPNTTRSEAA
ncbi:hypothetical protein [Streptomyces sp. NPDC051684]|uniref:hypothetical protein n=1 Tax=Streptomyces sp. NPDC051684 TaxID=3365670 RepID=UPI0037B655E0